MPRPWTPLLDATEAHAARNSLNEIAAELQSFVESKLQPGAPQIEAEVGEGLSGLAVFFAYLEAAGFFPGARDLASRSMNASIEALAGQPMMPSLYGGFTGIAWAVQHVSSRLGETAEDFSEIDLAIETYVSRTPWKEDYDLISGLVGLGG